MCLGPHINGSFWGESNGKTRRLETSSRHSSANKSLSRFQQTYIRELRLPKVTIYSRPASSTCPPCCHTPHCCDLETVHLLCLPGMEDVVLFVTKEEVGLATVWSTAGSRFRLLAGHSLGNSPALVAESYQQLYQGVIWPRPVGENWAPRLWIESSHWEWCFFMILAVETVARCCKNDWWICGKENDRKQPRPPNGRTACKLSVYFHLKVGISSSAGSTQNKSDRLHLEHWKSWADPNSYWKDMKGPICSQTSGLHPLFPFPPKKLTICKQMGKDGKVTSVRYQPPVYFKRPCQCLLQTTGGWLMTPPKTKHRMSLKGASNASKIALVTSGPMQHLQTKWAVAFKLSLENDEVQKETCSLNSFRASMQHIWQSNLSGASFDSAFLSTPNSLALYIKKLILLPYSSAYDEHLNISSALPHEHHMCFLFFPGVFCTICAIQ